MNLNDTLADTKVPLGTMKKIFCLMLTILSAFLFIACSYTDGDSSQVIKNIEITSSGTAVKVGEKTVFKYESVTDSGRKEELSPDDVEYYLSDADIKDVVVEKGNTFKFNSPKKYEIKFRKKNELSIKGKIVINAYDDKNLLAAGAIKLEDVLYATENGKEIKATMPKNSQPLSEIETYAYLKESGAAEIKNTVSLDCKKYYNEGKYNCELELTYFVLIKILKDGKPADIQGMKIIAIDEKLKKCVNVYNNISDVKGADALDYIAFLGNPEGEKFTDTVLTKDAAYLYEHTPERFIFSKDISFCVLCDESGRYEIIVDAIVKDSKKKFHSSSYLLEVLESTKNI